MRGVQLWSPLTAIAIRGVERVNGEYVLVLGIDNDEHGVAGACDSWLGTDELSEGWDRHDCLLCFRW